MQINISTRLLQAFLALDECRHFTRAAERCHVSQSAFSAVIQKLEDAIGTPLFNRDTRNVTLTPEGELFVEVARQLMADIESAFSDLRDHVARRKGRVAIAALPSLAANWLPPVIADYRRRYPDITVELYDVLSDQCLELLRQGKAELALTAPGQNSEEFETRTLCSEGFYLVCHRDHPLAKRRCIRLSSLAGCEFIHLARTSSVRQHLDPALRSVPLVNVGLEVEHLATLAGLIANGLGVSLVPELTLFQFRHPDLVAVPLDEAAIVRPILIVERKGRRLSVAAQGMLELIEARLAHDRHNRSKTRRQPFNAASSRARR
jgi:LysR family transcriptional regulator, carnitine catabolism transcriptional activator